MNSAVRIGLMTWHSYANYGSALQAAALYDTIEKLGYVPEFIDYRPRGTLCSSERLTLGEGIRKIGAKLRNHAIKHAYDSPSKTSLFKEFMEDGRKKGDPANSFPELKALAKCYDALVCGSDQIWSPICFDANYFLPFETDPSRKIAYAPSIGVTDISDSRIESEISNLLQGFGSLSCREERGAELLSSISGRDIKTVLDPTLLLDAGEWSDIGAEIETPEDGYILCYFLGDYRRYAASIERYEKQTGLSVITIPTYQSQPRGGFSSEIGPKEFVSLIKKASLVITDSFHGVAFSVNFNVPFVAFKRFSDKDPRCQNSRVTGLLSALGLGFRLASPKDEPLPLIFDFAEANEALLNKRRESLSYLEGSLAMVEPRKQPKGRERRSIAENALCCGCGACAPVCPVEAIAIIGNDNGFQTASVTTERCISCGLCTAVCPFEAITAKPIDREGFVFSYKSADKEGLSSSSSGGIGADIAIAHLSTNESVFGCVYERQEDAAKHVLVGRENMESLRGSKYLQSQSARAVASAVNREAGIVFFGTPCQIAGLDNVLRHKGKRDNALLIDLICHGVPTMHLWRKYLDERIDRKEASPHPDVRFRWKAGERWHKKMMMMMSSQGIYKKTEDRDDFYAFFCSANCYAMACYECPYRERSAADIRIGDYWGPRFSYDHEGVSMVIAQTDKGLDELEALISAGAKSAAWPAIEYWEAQWPYNKQIPLDWESLIADLRQSQDPLSRIRKKYCRAYDLRMTKERLKSFGKVFIRKGNIER